MTAERIVNYVSLIVWRAPCGKFAGECPVNTAATRLSLHMGISDAGTICNMQGLRKVEETEYGCNKLDQELPCTGTLKFD